MPGIHATPHISDMDGDDLTFYLDRLNRPWVVLARSDQPTLCIQRVGCNLHPMDMPRQSIIPSSAWAQENWRVVSPDQHEVLQAIRANGGRI